MRILVLGLGNEYAGDDAVGVLAARALREELAGVADVVETAAHGLGLIEVLAGYDRVAILDSALTGRWRPGTVVDLDVAEVGGAGAPSLHEAGLLDLAALAGRLGLAFPEGGRVFAVEIPGPAVFGAGLSGAVERAIGPLCERVRRQVEAWAGEGAVTGAAAQAGAR